MSIYLIIQFWIQTTHTAYKKKTPKRHRRRVKLALDQRKYLKQFTHKCVENLKAKRYWEQEDLHDSKKVILDIDELTKEEISKLSDENITYDGIVESTM